MRGRYLPFLLLVALGLAGCIQQPPDAGDLARQSARQWLDDARSRWTYRSNTYVQDPEYSARYLSGDCDDFAVMVAAHLQGEWGFDTFVACLRALSSARADHAVCFVDASAFPQTVLDALLCGEQPCLRMTGTGCLYRAIDWDECSVWDWTDFDLGVPVYNLRTGRVEWVYTLEWWDALHYVMTAGG